MALRTGHGAGAGVPRVEVLPADELPRGRPGPGRPVPNRGPGARFAKGPATTALARAGGLAAAQARQMGRLMGLWVAPTDHPFAPYARLAREWRDGHMRELADTVGGGRVGPGPASIVATAALQLGASRWLADKGALEGDARLLLESSKLADSSRQNLLAAHELCAREAKARPATASGGFLERLAAAAQQPEPEPASNATAPTTATSDTATSNGADAGTLRE